MRKITIGNIYKELKSNDLPFEYHGKDNLELERPSALENLEKGCIAFLREGNIKKYEKKLNFGNLLIARSFDRFVAQNCNLLITPMPEIAFYAITRLFLEPRGASIDKSAIIAPDAKVGNNVTVKAFAYIGPKVIVGDNSIIGESCVIKNSCIGEHTVIQPGVKIGGEALGALKDEHYRWHDRPHFFGVKIGSHVRIEDNAVISRGYLKDTKIESNVRIATGAWVGNGVEISHGSQIAQSVTVAGSVYIGKNTSIWGNASVREGVKIGQNCVIGMGAVVIKDIPDNELWLGNPAHFKKTIGL